MTEAKILRLAIPSPLRRQFDYLPPAGVDGARLKPGIRLRVPFGRHEKTGLLLSVETNPDVPLNKLKSAIAILDTQPLLDRGLLDWLIWMNDYYHHAIGDTLFSAMPSLLRQGKPAIIRREDCWRVTELGTNLDSEQLKRASKQSALLELLRQHPDGLSRTEINAQLLNWRPSIKAMIKKGWVEGSQQVDRQSPLLQAKTGPKLNPDQQHAVDQVCMARHQYRSFLLDGVTGSGKTEVYLSVIEQVVRDGSQALLMIPEIGLTPQLVDRFQQRFGQPIALLHSGLNDKERLNAWLEARSGQAKIVIGTRSAIFTPFAKLGVIIVDEEHDLSYKQQDGLRYHARDIAVTRAHRLHIPIVLGSATPSLESMANLAAGRFQSLPLPRRAGNAAAPRIERLDLRHQPMLENMAEKLLQRAEQHLLRGEQVLFFLNRRGFAPSLICHECGWAEHCHRCDSHMTLHQSAGRLRCHHCGAERPIPRQCPQCSNPDIRPQGYGTERIEQTLQQRFPEHEVIRVDRDTTRRKGSMQQLFDRVRQGEGQVLLGTQMLAKGHDFPNVTLAAILDADQGLFGTDFRATERLAQLITQVAGRAGRGDKPGTVVIQTHQPDHPLLERLLSQGYNAFAQSALNERREARLPPYSHAALFRAEAGNASQPQQFLSLISQLCHNTSPALDCLGPIPSPMERRAGRYRAQLLLLSRQRQTLHRWVAECINQIAATKMARKVRWSIDIDPQDLN